MACGCDPANGGTTVVSACCSIHGLAPSGVGVRWTHHGGAGAPTGFKIPVFQADASPGTLIVPAANQRFTVYHLSLVVELTGDSLIYRGISTGDDATPNNIIMRGFYSANGGQIANFPLVRLALGEDLFVKAAGLGAVDVIGYGVLETV